MKVRWKVIVATALFPLALLLELVGQLMWRGGFWLKDRSSDQYEKLVEWAGR